MNLIPTRSLILFAMGVTSCCVASVAAEGDRQVVTWNRWPGNPRACALVPSELLDDSQATSKVDAGYDSSSPDGGGTRNLLRANELRAYRLCEAYGNGALSEAEYRQAVLKANGAAETSGNKGGQ